MTPYEVAYRCLRAFDHPLNQRVYRILVGIEQQHSSPMRLLDVGGRRSPYTIGLRGRVVITDLPRESELQHSLNLGATDALRRTVLSRRSNVDDYVLDDMTDTKLAGQSFDLVVAVEVLEHVDADERFVANVARLLRPGGAFVMTTPNGELLPVPYPDHKRHYRREPLRALLLRHFSRVELGQAVRPGFPMTLGVRKPGSARRPPLRPLGYFLAARLERFGPAQPEPLELRHHVAVAVR